MAATSVAVFFGGPSAEHEISIRSADSLIGWLSAGGLAVGAFHLRRDGRVGTATFAPLTAGDGEATALSRARPASTHSWGGALESLAGGKFDAGFPIVHGTLGEDGSLQGFLATIELPCVGCDVLASALAMDKQKTKSLLMATTELRMPRGETIAPHEAADEVGLIARLARLALPLIIKPVDGGSSYGLSRVTERAGLPVAIRLALGVEGSTGALVEEQVVGDEVTCAVIGDAARGIESLPPILIRPHHGGMFDLEAKYTHGATDEICPAPLPPSTLARIEAAAKAAYRAIGCRGFARVDFILADGVPWFLELNTLPGLTRESLFPRAVRAAGLELPALFRRLVEDAMHGSRARAKAAR
ncbi:MAG: ATP-grasp domain-containing protein [Planctomycetes bacterium]|nr:ATP-grasp domain-containing protein [Planctomycetota bacterium]